MVVIQDTREKKPFKFPPHISVVKKKLDCGDYTLKGMEGRLRIERKNSMREVYSCMTGARERQFRAVCKKMMKYPIAFIVVQGTLGQLTHDRVVSYHAPVVVDFLVSLYTDYGLPWFLIGETKWSGLAVLRLLERIKQSGRVPALGK